MSKLPDPHDTFPYACDKFCKIHYYWNFDRERHERLPTAYNIRMQSGWRSSPVFVGPPGYKPYRPLPVEWVAIRRDCVHEQMDLTCNTCLRHMFRPLEI
jgi:hypothetical protein